MAHIHLIRHGQASFGQANYDRLSGIGEQQAEVLGQHYQRLAVPIAGLYSGTLQRQADSAEIARRSNPVWPTRQEDAAFNEFDADGLFRVYLPQLLKADSSLREQVGNNPMALFGNRQLFQRVFEQLIQRWTEAATPASGRVESWADFTGRVEAGLQRLHAAHGKHDVVLLFTSGGVISAATRRALALDNRHTFRINWNIANTSITHLQTRASGVYLHGLNNFTHLELVGDDEMITYR